MEQSLKKTAASALFWSFIDKGGQQFIQFIIFYVLTRLIVKADFGLIGVLSVFTVIANLLQESGFSSALIRKKTVLSEEYSSVFYFNVSMSLLIYALLFFSAPLIGVYYNQPLLTNLSRFIFLSFVFNAFSIVQNVNLVKALNFKTNTRITLLAGIFSGGIAIFLAYTGFGVWSLASQLVIQSFLRCVLLWFYVKWRPLSFFSIKHIHSMSSYSLKLLLTSLMNQVCANIIPLILGKRYSFSDVASYTQGNKLANIPQSIISDGIKSVAYPLVSHIGYDKVRAKKVMRKMVRITSFISFPVALLLIAIAKPVITIYLPQEWGDTALILQILAIGGAFYPLHNVMGVILQYKGKSGQYFWIEFIRNTLLILSISLTYKMGVLGLVSGMSGGMIVTLFVNAYYAGKTITYSLKEILLDMFPYFCISLFLFFPMIWIDRIGVENIFLRILIPLFGGGILYLLVLKILGSVIIEETINLFKFKKL